MKKTLFYQSVVMHHFYVSSCKHLKVISSEIIRNEKTYYVEWYYATEKSTTYLTLEEINWIADSMKIYLGADNMSTKAWNTLYLKCYHEEKKETIITNL